MKTRIRPYEYSVHSSNRWAVEIFDLHERNDGKWVTNSKHRYFWKANWRANRLAKGSLAERFNVKERFTNRLKFGDDNGE